MRREDNKGFTLAELLIVVAIIGVLVAVSIPIFTKQLTKSKQAVDLANMRNAKAAATADWMTDQLSNSEGYSKFYDAQKGSMTTEKPEGYGQSSISVESFDTKMEGASGIPNNGTPTYITVKIDESGNVTLKWGGNDLSTAAGRRQEDIDNMNSIVSKLQSAYDNGEIKFYKNFNQISVYSDGDGKIKDYRAFIDTYGYESQAERDAQKQKLIDIVNSAGIGIDQWHVYSTDEKWKYGYTINISKDGTISVYANAKGSKSSDGGYWYKPNYITDEDRQ